MKMRKLTEGDIITMIITRQFDALSDVFEVVTIENVPWRKGKTYILQGYTSKYFVKELRDKFIFALYSEERDCYYFDVEIGKGIKLQLRITDFTFEYYRRTK